ncbi:MAG: aminotransferase class III-fold pyridoxal phosphate-dependent enzyme [Pyrinomonadaceae bacterium]|nr:aminotransferase class III-fold pyridoxal phosphate-dependent enzyme [Pyrinomonadaceae bacterium]MCX7640136.1 aminotransferase class III-fold pyridoxal phosphate-dependent enzyme [Pyrinomonadaceae bacterium]MDW8303276.1 aminotransferase class III-fold pyridoxal phosphate-dependent enzyme [Acidobacteriota bacterium]
MSFVSVKELEDKLQVETYAKMNLLIERGQGAYVWTNEGERYLDLYGGHAVCATGHCHPHVVASLKAQLNKLIFYSNIVYSEVRAKAAEKLVSVAPKSLKKVFFCNSGAEANENAMKMARLVTGRKKIVSFSGSFHGRTADAISATFLGNYRKLAEPNVPFHVCAEFGSVESVKKTADEETAAIIIEPIQSMAGVREAEPEFFVFLRRFCDEKGILLIFDEIQTGMGRTGNWFFAGSPLSGFVEPDILTLAKSLGSGVPVGACLVNERVAKSIKRNDLGTTFGGGMLAVAAVIATIEAIEIDGMLEKIVKAEKYLREKIKQVPEVKDVFGKGGILAIEFYEDAAGFYEKLLKNKIITGTSANPFRLRLLPPLCIGKEEIDLLIEALKR